MGLGLRAVGVVSAGLALAGCTTAAPRKGATVPAEVVVGADLGNDRPRVSYDGLMVRRRVVIAVQAVPDADLDTLRRQLDLAAARHGATLTTISASVLDPVVLATLAADVVVVLADGGSPADAGQLLDPALDEGHRLAEDVQRADVLSVLVHDLRFTVDTADLAAVSRAIDREGIISDALGSHTSAVGAHQLDITYTGPLLSDDLVEAVRRGVGRVAGVAPAVVAVTSRSTVGVGVDVSREPAPATTETPVAHHHGAPTTAGEAAAPTR